MSKMKKIDLIVFKDKNKEILRGLAFMTCPYCKKDILLQINKISFCEHKCRQLHGVAYKLNPDENSEEGFKGVSYTRTKSFNRKKLMEEFKNG